MPLFITLYLPTVRLYHLGRYATDTLALGAAAVSATEWNWQIQPAPSA